MALMRRNSILIFTLSMLFMFSACHDTEPDPDPNKKFIGSYQMQVGCNFIDGNNEQDNYTLNITKSSTSSTIQISNLFNTNQPLIATVDGNSFTITQGIMTIEDLQIEINGTGVLNGTTLNLNYNLAHQSEQIGTCTEAGQKK